MGSRFRIPREACLTVLSVLCCVGRGLVICPIKRVICLKSSIPLELILKLHRPERVTRGSCRRNADGVGRRKLPGAGLFVPRVGTGRSQVVVGT